MASGRIASSLSRPAGMMIEFEDRSEEEQRLLLRYLERAKPKPRAPKIGWFWRFVGRLYLAYLCWRYRGRAR
jgi:hypothetical protein